MSFRQNMESKLTLDRDERYLAGTFGLAGLIIEAAYSLSTGMIFGHEISLLGAILIWACLIALQILTVIALNAQPAMRSKSRWWLFLLSGGWIGFDLALKIFHWDLIWLPLLYGFTQALFLIHPDEAKSIESGRKRSDMT